MNKPYVGVGSRETPQTVLLEMHRLAACLAPKYILRSGAAPGADTAFEAGATSVGGECEIYLPWRGFANHPSQRFGPIAQAAYDMAATFHPAWERLTYAAKKLHARNCYQILGETFNDPVAFVVCWTPDGCESKATRTRLSGGTASAIVIGEHYGSQIFNLKNEASRVRLSAYLVHEGIDVAWLIPDNKDWQTTLF